MIKNNPNEVVFIKKGETFTVGEFIVERCRFGKQPDVIYKVVEVNLEVQGMKIMNWATKQILYADMTCHHSQGSRYTILTYKVLPNHPYVLFYEQS